MPARKIRRRKATKKSMGSKVSSLSLKRDRADKPKKYPLALAEKRLQHLHDYVRRRGGKVPR